jgi:hypothetical protein
MTRQCGGCTLCCRLLPQVELAKPANSRCRHQQTGRGCAIYDKRPPACRTWSCAWLIDPDASDLSRPDRARYVIDIVLDYVKLRDQAGEVRHQIPVLQIWLDPAQPDAWRDDKALRAFLVKRAGQGVAALMRTASSTAIAVFAPPMSGDGEWHYMESGGVDQVPHTAAETAAVLEAAGVRVSYEMVEE